MGSKHQLELPGKHPPDLVLQTTPCSSMQHASTPWVLVIQQGVQQLHNSSSCSSSQGLLTAPIYGEPIPCQTYSNSNLRNYPKGRYYRPHFINEDIKSVRFSNLLMVTWHGLSELEFFLTSDWCPNPSLSSKPESHSSLTPQAFLLALGV